MHPATSPAKPFTLRLATLADCAVVVDLGKRTFFESFAAANTEEDMALFLETAYHPEVIAAELRDPEQLCYLLEQDGLAVGFVKLRENGPNNYFEPGQAMELQRIYVLASHQNLRLGTVLMEHAWQVAREKAYPLIWLGVWDQNLAAIRFYQRMGFEAFGQHDFLLGNDLQHDVLMKRRL